ncbi:hypothetical protein QVD17_37589 [Tagetes erecta]|uniref:Uncharacterized protein n=1 Tax=Tagetes erecta TaxID=13708 RepID=A0AAD8NCU1_TARER|nr:hypothetical protein QVD17_37589 [Tagetes erecta]
MTSPLTTTIWHPTMSYEVRKKPPKLPPSAPCLTTEVGSLSIVETVAKEQVHKMAATSVTIARCQRKLESKVGTTCQWNSGSITSSVNEDPKAMSGKGPAYEKTGKTRITSEITPATTSITQDPKSTAGKKQADKIPDTPHKKQMTE